MKDILLSVKEWTKKFMVCLDTAYFAENWKHCSKIIFKCVNSVMGPIFNESFVEKKKFVGPVHSARDPLEKPIATETHG